MTSYILTLIAIVLAFIFVVASFFVDGIKKWSMGVGYTIALIVAFSAIVTMNVPKPEIYITKNNDTNSNVLCFNTKWPLKVKYTLVPYGNPKTDGIEFKKGIPIEQSMTISAKATFFGINWSELQVKDIIIGDDNQISILNPSEPGSSIKEISAHLIYDVYYPGDQLTDTSIEVEAKTLAGETVIIKDFSFHPMILSEGENSIKVTYQNLSCTIQHTVNPPQLCGVTAGCIKDGIRVGDTLTKEMFIVIGFFDNGEEKEFSDFSIEPKCFNEKGKKNVRISVGNLEVFVPVIIYE